LLVTALSVLWFIWGSTRESGYVTDFDQVWQASRTALAGLDPYAASIQPPAPGYPGTMGLFYPLTAVVITFPLSFLALDAARVIWIAVGVFSFTFLLLGRYSYARLPAVMSGAFLMAVSLAQWSPYLACAIMAPGFAWVLSGKPNVGLAAAVAARVTPTAILLALVPVVIAFGWRPTWIADWQHALTTGSHFHPYIVRPGGMLMLLSLLRWRRPEARWLAAMACIPATPGAAEALVLFAFPMTLRQCLCLALLTHAPNFLMIGRHFDTFDAFTDRGAILMLVFVYLPAVAVILTRPNAGSLPAPVERWAMRLPGWLRGRPA
jgi:hypothetical protein